MSFNFCFTEVLISAIQQTRFLEDCILVLQELRASKSDVHSVGVCVVMDPWCCHDSHGLTGQELWSLHGEKSSHTA